MNLINNGCKMHFTQTIFGILFLSFHASAQWHHEKPLSVIDSVNLGAVIQGIVTEYLTEKPIPWADVILDSNLCRTHTDNSGFFRFYNLPAGTYSLKVYGFTYKIYMDTIIIKKIDQFVAIDIKLKSAVFNFDTDAEIEEYHSYVNQFKPEEILEIKIDSIESFGRNDLSLSAHPHDVVVYSTFTNLTEKSIYVIRDVQCLRMIDPIIVNSENAVMESNSAFIDCVGMKERAYLEDFFEIKPHSSITYSPIVLYFNDFRRYPADEYSIRIKYRFKFVNKLPGISGLSPGDDDVYKEKNKDIIYCYSKALRGEYISVNSIEFENSEIIQLK